MINFDYDGVMKRHDVRVPQTIAGESSMLTVAHISGDDKLTLKDIEQILKFIKAYVQLCDPPVSTVDKIPEC